MDDICIGQDFQTHGWPRDESTVLTIRRTSRRTDRGEVARRIRDPVPEHRWVNTCAIRMSYILAQAGMPIPHLSGKTIPGRGHHQYFYRVKALRSFLQQRWGRADVQLNQPHNGLGLSGKQGVIIFGVSGWGDASGHASSFNGSSCYDKGYFNSPGAKYQTRDAVLWVLP